jgi:hypothetical protein
MALLAVAKVLLYPKNDVSATTSRRAARVAPRLSLHETFECSADKEDLLARRFFIPRSQPPSGGFPRQRY